MLRQLTGETAFVIGLVVFLGLLIQRKSVFVVIEGTIKAVIGYIILQFGAFLATQQLSELTVLLERTFRVQGIMPNNEMIAGISQWFYGRSIGFIMVFGMIIHIVIARYTRFKYVFLTGHHILYMASLVAGIVAGSQLPVIFQIAIASVVLGFSMTIFPAIAQPTMRKIVPEHSVAIGHFGSIGYVVSSYLAKKFGKITETSHKSVQQTTQMSILNNPNVIIMIFMLSLFLFVAIIAGRETFTQHTGNSNPLIYSLSQSFQFTAAIYMIIVGVRMMVTEVLTSFKGIADKLVPDAIPAIDSPVIFPYYPVAAVIGFVSSLIGGFLGISLLILFKMHIVLPAIIAHFFSGATAGVFGFVNGGYRGAVIGSIGHGIFITFLPLLLVPVMHQLGYTKTTFSESDFGIVGLLLHYFMNFLGHLFS